MLKRETYGEMMRFVIVGGVATLLHYVIYWLLLGLMTAGVAYTIGYLISFVYNYIMTTVFTFRSKTSWRNGIGFCMAHAVNYLLHIALLHVYLHFGVPEWIAPLPVYAVAIPVNFLLVRFAFKSGLNKKAEE